MPDPNSYREARRRQRAVPVAHPRHVGSSISSSVQSAVRNTLLIALATAAPNALAEGVGAPLERPIDNALTLVRPGKQPKVIPLAANPGEDPANVGGRIFIVAPDILDTIDECRGCTLRLDCMGATIFGSQGVNSNKRTVENSDGINARVTIPIRFMRGEDVSVYCSATRSGKADDSSDVRRLQFPLYVPLARVISRPRVSAAPVLRPAATPMPMPTPTPVATAEPLIPLAGTRTAEARLRQSAPKPQPTPAPATQPSPPLDPFDPYAAELAAAGIHPTATAAPEPEPTPTPTPPATAEASPVPIPPLVKPPPRLTPEEREVRDADRRRQAIRDELERWSVDLGGVGKVQLRASDFEDPLAPQIGVARNMTESFMLRASFGRRVVHQGIETSYRLRNPEQRLPGMRYDMGLEALLRRDVRDQANVRYAFFGGGQAGFARLLVHPARDVIDDPEHRADVPPGAFWAPSISGVLAMRALFGRSGVGLQARVAAGLSFAQIKAGGDVTVLPAVDIGGAVVWEWEELLK